MLRRSRSTMRLDSAEPMSPIPARINHPRARRSGEGNPVGLKIVIDGSSLDTNVVIKSSLRSPPPKPVGVEGFLPCSLPELSFLKACFLCKKQLSPEKDVYIYRGDRGFCSMECRCRQIFLDERRERCASALDRAAPPCGSGRKKSRTSGRGGIPAAA
ncbi:FCS-Like Zinc finger 17-like isoform X2 [Nymphaea colorata]|uniref:FCS-Like Zinc finger 17-like isoform X2 n=1 Tax=Nymphaea colorata TaxID=210225 RepID=UPI00129D5EA6|nr:FCS-Like Zinc finger 17-like isoform X2 [Nymphaea colorata]